MTPTTLIFPSNEELRRNTSIKWSRVSDDQIPMDLAELDLRVAPEIREALLRAIERDDLGYPNFANGTPVKLKELYAQRMSEHFGWNPDPSRVEICSQIIQALCCAVLAYTKPGDGVVVHKPMYPPIRFAIEHLGRRCIAIPAKDMSELSELEDYVSVYSGNGNIAMVVLCQPHNPTGKVFTRQTLDIFGHFVQQQKAILFSDEIHQDLVYEPALHHAPASVSYLADRTVSFTSTAKSFNIAGLRCAVGHFGSKRLHDTFSRLPWHIRDGASLLGVAASLAAWSDGCDWLEALRRHLHRNLRLIADELQECQPIRWTPPQATYLAWLDLRDTPAASGPRQYLLDTVQVALQDGTSYGREFSGFGRLNFGTSESRLRVALEKIIKGLSHGKELS